MSFVVLAVVDSPVSGSAPLAGVRTVRVGTLDVVIREVAVAPRVEPATLREQDAVVRAVAARWAAILPLRFGTVVASEGDLAGLLEPAAAVLRDGLARVRGNEQWTIRVRQSQAPSIPSTETANGISRWRFEDPTANGISRSRSADASNASLGPGARYLAERARIRSGGEIPSIAALERAVGALVSERLFVRHDTPGVIASLYHLVARADAAAYREAFTTLAPNQELRLSGPFPPYAFAPAPLA